MRFETPHARFASSARRFWTALRSDNRGAILVLAAVIFPVIVGAFGLGAETSYWFMSQRKLQHAADMAVHSAGARFRARDLISDITDAASYVAEESGFDSSNGTITINQPPVSGVFAGDDQSIEVILEEQRDRWFSAIFTSGKVSLTARAVSRVTGGNTACVLSLSPTASAALKISGSTQVTLNGCSVASNSNASDAFLMDGTTAQLTTGCVSSVGGAVVTSGLTLNECTDVKTNAPVTQDPYANVPEPALIGTCENGKIGKANEVTTLVPTELNPDGILTMRFCSGLDIKGQVVFSPGLYIIEGGSFDFNGGNHSGDSLSAIVGTGVTFYLADNANLQLNGNVQLNISAPTSGIYSGILFFGSRSATAALNQISGTSETTLQGAIYTPASQIEFAGNSTITDGCTQVIGSTVTLTGNSDMQSDCDFSGTETILANQTISIAE